MGAGGDKVVGREKDGEWRQGSGRDQGRKQSDGGIERKRLNHSSVLFAAIF